MIEKIHANGLEQCLEYVKYYIFAVIVVTAQGLLELMTKIPKWLLNSLVILLSFSRMFTLLLSKCLYSFSWFLEPPIPSALQLTTLPHTPWRNQSSRKGALLFTGCLHPASLTVLLARREGNSLAPLLV